MTYRVADGASVSLGLDGRIGEGQALTDAHVERFGPEGIASLLQGGSVVEVTDQPKTKGSKE